MKAPSLRPWFAYSLAAMFVFALWAAQMKYVSSRMSSLTNQALATLGLVAITLPMLSGREPIAGSLRRGAMFALLTGLLGSLGNVALFEALRIGGKASIITPMTALYPAITVLLAGAVMQERLRGTQTAGLLVAGVAIVLLGM